MQILIIHLSDLHLNDKTKNILLNRRQELINSIKNRVYDIEQIFFIISGDIAFKGSQTEYLMAKKFFDNIISELEDYTNIKVNILFVPGNHDCDFGEENIARNVLINNVFQTETCDNSLIDIITLPQTSYFDFSSIYHTQYNIVFQNKLNTIIEFKLDKNKKIKFSLLNTAWISKRKEENGKLFMPVKSLNINRTGSFNVAVFHHNFNWLEANNARSYKHIIERNHDLILTGHEHTSTLEKRISGESSIEQIEGGVLQDSNQISDSSFNFILVDLKEKKLKLNKFKWESHIYKEVEESEWTTYAQEKKYASSKHNISEKFDKWLCDAGANYQHPRKRGEIALEDIYVYPELEKLSEDKDEELKIDYKDSRFLFDEKKTSGKKFLIIGSEKSGKTSLSKLLYKNYWLKGVSLFIFLGQTLNIVIFQNSSNF